MDTFPATLLVRKTFHTHTHTHTHTGRVLKLHAKFTPGWVLIQVNFDPIQEIGPKVGGGHSFKGGCSCETTVLLLKF